jgi:hypothetical protein
MGVIVLASGHDVMGLVARLTVDLGVPLTGLILLIAGLWERSRSRQKSRPGYPYPPGPPPMGYPGPPQPYPGYPPSPNYPPYPGYPPYPAPAPPRRASGASTTLITIGAVVLALGIFGDVANAVRRLGQHQQRTSMRVGECITQMAYRSESFTSSRDHDCANPANTYLLAAKGGSSATCPDGKREGSLYDRYTDSSTILCFALNLRQGQCYLIAGQQSSPEISLGDCNATQAGEMRVAQRIDGTTDTSGCADGDKGVSYPTPPIVYCLEKLSSF